VTPGGWEAPAAPGPRWTGHSWCRACLAAGRRRMLVGARGTTGEHTAATEGTRRAPGTEGEAGLSPVGDGIDVEGVTVLRRHCLLDRVVGPAVGDVGVDEP